MFSEALPRWHRKAAIWRAVREVGRDLIVSVGWRADFQNPVATPVVCERGSNCHIASAFVGSWSMELSLRHLKSTLQMDHLSCLNPHNLQREIHLHFLVYNLVRRLMLESARTHRVPLERISFAGSLAAARRYSEALLQIRTQRHRRQLWEELLRVIAEDLVPDRPGRREPRAIKRRPKPYPRLMQHRHILRRELSHQNRYYQNSPFGPKYRTNRES